MNAPWLLYCLAFLAAMTTSWLCLPWWRAWCLRHDWTDQPGHRKIHSEPTPLAGGFAVLTGILAPVLAGLVLVLLPQAREVLQASDTLQYGLLRRALPLGAILLGAVAMTLLGAADDRLVMRPGKKFLGQCLIALMVAAAGVRITLFVHNPVFSYLVTVFWILTLVNATNFLDNMNGLCSGLGVIGAFAFAMGAAVRGQYLVAIVAWLMCGALAGFLPHNFPKARAFLGDAGSHLVGYLLAVLAILPHYHSAQHPNPLAVISPLIILGVPLGDLACVVWIRWKAGKPFYEGDTNHLSHRLVRRGFSRSTAVLLIWLMATALAWISFLLFPQ